MCAVLVEFLTPYPNKLILSIYAVHCSLQKLVVATYLHLYKSSGFVCQSVSLSVTLFSSVYHKVLHTTCVSCTKGETLLCPDMLFMTCHLFVSFCSPSYLIAYSLLAFTFYRGLISIICVSKL